MAFVAFGAENKWISIKLMAVSARLSMKNFLYVLPLLSLVGTGVSGNVTALSGSPFAQATAVSQSARPIQASPNKSTPPYTLPPSAGKWVYEKRVDKSGSTVYKASFTSPGVLTFAFPYAGGSAATLTLRHKNDQTYLYLEVSRGQFNRTFQGGKARIAFDSKPAKNYSFSAAENGRANIIFFDDEAKLIAQMKAARKMTIDVEFYAQGRRTIEFSTADLSWNH
jgi:hypothetical protein